MNILGGIVDSIFGGGSSSPPAPAAPDYTGAAQATAAGDLANLKYQTQANRPTVTTPWGTLTWSNDGNNNWTQNVSLTPQTQQALNSQMGVQENQSSLANGMQGQVARTMSTPFNAPTMGSYLNGVPSVNSSFAGFNPGNTQVDPNAPKFSDANAKDGANAAYSASTSLIQPQWDQQNKNLDSSLRLQGLTPGTEAYDNAMQNNLRTQAQTQSQLANQAVLTGNQEANTNYASALAGYNAGNTAQEQNFGQALAGYGANTTAQQAGNAAQAQQYQQGMGTYQTAYQSALQNYLQPLNSMNAVLTGQQVTPPTFSNLPNSTAGNVAGPNLLAATSALGSWNQGLYNAQQANATSQQNGILGLAGSVLGAAGNAGGFGNLLSFLG